MIENEINIGNKFKMRVNFNLIKKGGEDEKRQIWLTTTINKERARVYTGLRIEQCFWVQKSHHKGKRKIPFDTQFQEEINKTVKISRLAPFIVIT